MNESEKPCAPLLPLGFQIEPNLQKFPSEVLAHGEIEGVHVTLRFEYFPMMYSWHLTNQDRTPRNEREVDAIKEWLAHEYPFGKQK